MIPEGTMAKETWTGGKNTERSVRDLLDKEGQLELSAMENKKKKINKSDLCRSCGSSEVEKSWWVRGVKEKQPALINVVGEERHRYVQSKRSFQNLYKVAAFGYFLLDKAQRAEKANSWVTGRIVILFSSDKEDS